MTIIDKYITDNYRKSAKNIAADLGVSESFVNARKADMIISDKPKYDLVDQTQEIHALLNLIEERKTGWAVDAAKDRIRHLENAAKRSVNNNN